MVSIDHAVRHHRLAAIVQAPDCVRSHRAVRYRQRAPVEDAVAVGVRTVFVQDGAAIARDGPVLDDENAVLVDNASGRNRPSRPDSCPGADRAGYPASATDATVANAPAIGPTASASTTAGLMRASISYLFAPQPIDSVYAFETRTP